MHSALTAAALSHFMALHIVVGTGKADLCPKRHVGTSACAKAMQSAAFALSPESPVCLHLPASCAANSDISYGWGFLALKVLFGENESVVPSPQTIPLSHQSALAKQQKAPP